MSMMKEFREFAMRGNVVDMAIGVIMGGAFGKIVSSLVSDVIMPPIGLLTGNVDFSSVFVDLSGKGFESIAQAKQAGAPTINIGVWLMTVIDFVIVAFVIFLVVRAMNTWKRQPPPAEPTTKECPFCCSNIPLKARRCAHCTAELA